MNQPTKPSITTAKPPHSTPSQFSAGPPKAATQAKFPEAKGQPTQTQAAPRSVRFELEAPKASSVFLVGTFNDWKTDATPLNRVAADKWSRELALASGRYEYRFLVDGTWIDDPKAKAYLPNPYGGRNAVLEV